MRTVQNVPDLDRGTRRDELAGDFTARRAEARDLGRLAAAGVLATAVLALAEILLSPSGALTGEIAFTIVTGLTLVVTSVLLRTGARDLVLTATGAALMLLGIAAGAFLPDGLDAAAVLPLAGAVLTLPAHRGRPLVWIFAMAWIASMAGETLALAGGSDVSALSVPHSLAVSGVMLALVYTLIWWIGDRWWAANTSARHALVSQRRLLEVNERLLSTLDPESVLSLIADSLKSLVAYDNLSIYRVDRAAGVLRPVLARDRFAALIMDNTFSFRTGITGWVVEHGEAQCVNDTAGDPRATTIPGTPEEPESLIVVPLLVRGEVAGTLNMGRMGRKEAHFSESEFELARLFAGQASIALQNAEAHQAVWTRAETDSLTELHNRGSFDVRLANLMARPADMPLALIMVDLDGFKAYNDSLGHPAGDAVLRQIGTAIGSAVRDRDLAFRYGGDEFAILLPRTDPASATAIARRVCRAIGEVVPAAGPRVTASAGVAVHPDDAPDAAALVAAADGALYRAKASGGKQIQTASIRGSVRIVEVAAEPDPTTSQAGPR